MKDYPSKNPRTLPIEPAEMLDNSCRKFVVIPVFAENAHLPAALKSIRQALKQAPEKVRILLVINAPPGANAEDLAQNQTLLTRLSQNDPAFTGGLVAGEDLFWLNVPAGHWPEKHCTVGSARKIGLDSCLRTLSGLSAPTDGWLFSLDADTLIDENYFLRAHEWQTAHPDHGGAVFHFAHRWEDAPDLALAAMRYELWMRDYARLVRQCGSRYGFWSIGSAFMVRISDYMRSGGMRRHSAGEDFYFLQALRKVTSLGAVPGTTVYPAGRLSGRVPFGTGPAIARQLAGEMQQFYNPRSFELLKEFFTAAETADLDILHNQLLDLAPEKMRTYLLEQDFTDKWHKIVCNTPPRREAILSALHTYCDGFFILKFCHAMAQRYPAEFGKLPPPSDCDLPRLLDDARQQDAHISTF